MTEDERIAKKVIKKTAIYLYGVSTIICDKFDSCNSCPFCNAPCYDKDRFINWFENMEVKDDD